MRLRDREMTLSEQNADLTQTIEQLKQTLMANNISLSAGAISIPTPASTQHTAPFAIPPLSAGSMSFSGRTAVSEAPVTINLTELGLIEPSKPCSMTAALGFPTPYEDPSADLEFAYQSPDDEQLMGVHGTPVTSTVLTTALSTQSAVDFVLEYVMDENHS